MGGRNDATPTTRIGDDRPPTGRLTARSPNWRDERWGIDLGLVVSATMAVLTEQVVVWFHLIFVLLVIAALLLPFKMLVVRVVIWTIVSTLLVTWAVIELDVPSDELSELPILTLVIAIVFLVARSRAKHHDDLIESRRIINEQLQVERDNLRLQLEQSQRLDVLGRASAQMAHDLLSVFTIIRGCADDLAEAGSVEQRAAATDVLEAVERGNDMLSEFLVAGRAQVTPPSVIDIGAAVRRAEPMLKHLIRPGIVLDIATPNDPAFVAIARTELVQVLMNLVSNAVDAIDGDGAITVLVDSAVSTRGNNRVTERSATLTVHDSGRGLVGSDITCVFDPGFTTKRGPHSGLGLAMVSDIVARAGGDVDLASRSGGTTARVTLPLAFDVDPRIAAVLIDEPELRAMIERELTALRYSIDNVEPTGEPRTWKPSDLVVIDDAEAVSRPTDQFGDARVLDIADVIRDARGPLTPQRAAVLVRRLVSDGSTPPGATVHEERWPVSRRREFGVASRGC